jgi:hypothetical protein
MESRGPGRIEADGLGGVWPSAATVEEAKLAVGTGKHD